jgi:MFS family permease
VLQWSRASDHIGRKPVILIGLLGTTLSMLAFGLSRTFWALVLRYYLQIGLRSSVNVGSFFSRCLSGLLNGNIGMLSTLTSNFTDGLSGVMKSVMGELTDSTNRAEGFSLMPVVWGFGATIGYVSWQAFGITSVPINERSGH